MKSRINKKIKLKNSNELIGEEKNQKKIINNKYKDKSPKNSNSLNEVSIFSFKK